ncbi:hypothetical protein KUTeg_022585 [Tegillarca granosa]|uniref:Microtubule-associated protein futsch n=1 Tax=Tegillarca granosa TaxID=220873 RepID=A0ABQ9E319_TEGGR|nr:hypothetical protein KUTeg_022585 [Tegillarca granosa]
MYSKGSRNFLSSSSIIRHLIYAGQYFGGNGSWILQDGTFSVANLSHMFKISEEDIKIQNGCKFTIFCSGEGEWKSSAIAKFSGCKNWEVEVNPAEKFTFASGVLQFTAYVSNFLRTKTVDELLRTSDVVGNIRFSKPTLYIFPGAEGDSSLFGISGFNLLVNGGFKRRSCFWDFCRHLDRIDAVLMTHLGTDNVFGVSSMLQRKNLEDIHPEIGYIYLNADSKTLHSSVGKESSLSVSLADEGNKIIEMSKQLGLVPHPCTRNGTSKDLHPINLYHKVGHGSLDMYILNPVTDSKELKDFYQQWNKQVADFGSLQNVSLPNMLSVCSLLVWKPANPTEKICRIFFTGNAPQHKVLEGLDKIKQLDILKHANCTGQSLQQSKGTAKKGTTSSARPASARTEKTPRPASSTIQKKPETKETARTVKQKPPVQKSTKTSKEDENKQKAEDKTAKTKTTSHAKLSPAKAAKTPTPKKTSPVEKAIAIVNSSPEKAVKEEAKTEKPKQEETPPTAPPPEPVVKPQPEPPAVSKADDLLSFEEEKVAAAVKAAEEALQQSFGEPAKTSDEKSESPEPLPDPSHYNAGNAPKEPTEIIPQEQFHSSVPDPFGLQNQKLDSVMTNGGSNADQMYGFEENHVDDSENVIPESLPEPVAYSTHEPDIIPETDTFKEQSMPDSMMASSMIQQEPDVIQSAQNESDLSSADSALVTSPKDEELKSFEEEEAAINEVNDEITAEEKVVCENVVNGVLDNLDDDGIMYDDDEEADEVGDELEKDAETEKDVTACSSSMPVEEQKDDLLPEKTEKQEQEDTATEMPVSEKGKQREDLECVEPPLSEQKDLNVESAETELFEKQEQEDVDLDSPVSETQEPEIEETESAKMDLSPAEVADIQDKSPMVEKQEQEMTDEPEETESEQAELGVKEEIQEQETLEETESERTDPFVTPEVENKDSISLDKQADMLPDEAEQRVDVTDNVESKEDEEQDDDEDDELSSDGGDSQTGCQRDSLSPEPDIIETSVKRESPQFDQEDVIKPANVVNVEQTPEDTGSENVCESKEAANSKAEEEEEEEEELKKYEKQIEEEIQNMAEANGDHLESSNIPEAFEKDETPDPKDIFESQQDAENEEDEKQDDHAEEDLGEEDVEEMDEEGEECTETLDTSPDSDIVIDHQTGASYNPFGDVKQAAYNPFEGLDQGVEKPESQECGFTQTNGNEQFLQEQGVYKYDSGKERAPQMYGIGFGMEKDTEQMDDGSLEGQTFYRKGMVPESDQDPQAPGSAGPWDPETEWGKPMGLPSPAPPPEEGKSSAAAKTSPKSKTTTKTTTAKTPDSARTNTKKGPPASKPTENKTKSSLNTSRTEPRSSPAKRPASAAVGEPKTKTTTSRRPATTTGNSRSSPLVTKMPPLPPFTAFYVDLTYIPTHGDTQYSNIDFFKRIRARYYVISSLSPNVKTLDALLDAKETWEDKELQVTIIPTYDHELLRHWMGLNKDRLSILNVDLAPSANRCTIQLQDHETSCSAYRLEF